MQRLLSCWLATTALLAQQTATIPVVAPPSWSGGDVQGSQVFRPGDLAQGATFAIVVPPSVAGTENFDQILEAGKRTISGGGGFHAAPQAVTGRSRGGWDFKYVLGDFQRGPGKFVGIVAAVRRAGQVGYILAMADSSGTLQKYAKEFVSFLDSLGVEAGPAATPAAKQMPASSPGLSGVYFGLERGLSLTAAGTSYGNAGSLYIFLADGTYRHGLPMRGYPSDLPYDRSAVPSRWGTWAQTANEIVARRDREVLRFGITDGTTLTERDGNQEWHRLAPFPEGLRLEGSFVRADGERRPESPRLVLLKDGRFQTKGPFCQMIGSLHNIVEPRGYESSNVPYGETDPIWKPGEGTYEFRGFSLTLRHRDGRVLQFAAYLPAGQDPQSPRVVGMGDSSMMARE
jgi:hypothetical protein